MQQAHPRGDLVYSLVKESSSWTGLNPLKGWAAYCTETNRPVNPSGGHVGTGIPKSTVSELRMNWWISGTTAPTSWFVGTSWFHRIEVEECSWPLKTPSKHC